MRAGGESPDIGFRFEGSVARALLQVLVLESILLGCVHIRGCDNMCGVLVRLVCFHSGLLQ